MKKVIRLSESELSKLIKNVIKEQSIVGAKQMAAQPTSQPGPPPSNPQKFYDKYSKLPDCQANQKMIAFIVQGVSFAIGTPHKDALAAIPQGICVYDRQLINSMPARIAAMKQKQSSQGPAKTQPTQPTVGSPKPS